MSRSRKAECGHEASLVRRVARTFGRRLRPGNGHSDKSWINPDRPRPLRGTSMILQGPRSRNVSHIPQAYAEALGRFDTASYQRCNDLWSSGMAKLSAFTAKSTVAIAVISATE